MCRRQSQLEGALVEGRGLAVLDGLLARHWLSCCPLLGRRSAARLATVPWASWRGARACGRRLSRHFRHLPRTGGGVVGPRSRWRGSVTWVTGPRRCTARVVAG